ncbi:MAG: hypothetical protein HYR85_11050 [Planctomycetes bacterium]|nr:hypothetical protein [Planctomycetota bacterium]MBI3845740.1 hypothetical protein [Planctomycetota bacterium]
MRSMTGARYAECKVIVGAVLVAAVAMRRASADPKTTTVVFQKSGKIVVDGKESTSPDIEKSFTDVETENHPPDVRVRLQMEEGAAFGPVRTVLQICVKHKVRVDSLDATPPLKADESTKPETVHVEIRFNERERQSTISIDDKDVTDLVGSSAGLKSLADPVRTELATRTEKNAAIAADVLVVGGPNVAHLGALVEAMVRAKVRTIRFGYKDV